MSLQISPNPLHPLGEAISASISRVTGTMRASIAMDTIGPTLSCRDPQAPVTLLGQLVLFCQFLSAGGLYPI
jgi:hypothetical protein